MLIAEQAETYKYQTTAAIGWILKLARGKPSRALQLPDLLLMHSFEIGYRPAWEILASRLLTCDSELCPRRQSVSLGSCKLHLAFSWNLERDNDDLPTQIHGRPVSPSHLAFPRFAWVSGNHAENATDILHS